MALYVPELFDMWGPPEPIIDSIHIIVTWLHTSNDSTMNSTTLDKSMLVIC